MTIGRQGIRRSAKSLSRRHVIDRLSVWGLWVLASFSVGLTAMGQSMSFLRVLIRIGTGLFTTRQG